MSALKLVTGTTFEPVTRDEMKTWLRADENEIAEDGLIDSLIARARARLEELQQRAFLIQTFDYYLDAMPRDSCSLALPKAPLVSVVSIKGFQSSELTDTGGTAMSTSGYYVDTAQEFGRVMPLQEFTYPTATRAINAAIIRFTAGYSSGSSGVPESAKTEIKQLVARLYEHRGDEVELMKVLMEHDSMPSELDLPSWG
jgi:uncharacterized phiE125 gp8 family phage protein